MSSGKVYLKGGHADARAVRKAMGDEWIAQHWFLPFSPGAKFCWCMKDRTDRWHYPEPPAQG